MNYKVIKDYKIVPKGTILIPDDNGHYIFEMEDKDIITSMTLNTNVLKDEEFFVPHEPIEVTISESDLDDKEKKSWKVVFNVKCTEKTLLEIKKAIENSVNEIV
jgi:hypothetical protein